MSKSFCGIARCFVLTLAAAGLVACSTKVEPPPWENGGGGNPTGTGGRVGAGGSTATTHGTGGRVGTGGTTNTSGGTGGAIVSGGTDGTACPVPTQPLITDFTYDASSTSTSEVHFGGSGAPSGGEYIYPTGTDPYPLKSDVTGGNWHITGNVGTYSGFGLYFDGCNRIDASAYAGISFKVSGTVEQEGGFTLVVDTLNDSITAAWLNAHGGSAKATDPGRCEPPASAPNQWAQSDCLSATQVIPVTDTPTVQTIMWSDFAGGKPEAVVTPSDIIGIHWFLPNPPGAGTDNPTPYKVDITLDDLAFVPK